MKTALLYPVELIVFWYHDVCLGVIDFFVRLNAYLLRLFSIVLLLKTFFKPVKNEYRKGLVLFSRVLGVVIKGVILSITLSFMLIFLIIQLIIIALFFMLPFILIYLIYAGSGIFQII